MTSESKNKYRAWRLIQRIDGVGRSRKECKRLGLISSLNTKKGYHSCIKRYLDWRDENGLTRFDQDKLTDLENFLSELSEICMQKTIDHYRCALTIVFKKKLSNFKSQISNDRSSRNYYLSEVLLILQNLQQRNAIGILLCFFVGLRAHEICTLRRADEAKKSKSRKWSDDRFHALGNYQTYLVTGKGGLVREVAIPKQLVSIIETVRLDCPKDIYDRGIKYQTYYDLGFGKALSECFSRSSNKILNWSTGLHGLRHSYAQNRMLRLVYSGMEYESALKIVSEELGHFRANITLCYLR